MRNPRIQLCSQVVAAVGLLSLLSGQVLAQYLPNDAGTSVNGFQDDFDGTTLKPGWVVSGANVYSVANGVLHVTSASGDPNHLLYQLAGYDNTVQEVLARMRILNYGPGDLMRAGLAVGVGPASSQGINYHFRNDSSDGQGLTHLAFLDDRIVWGPVQNFVWQTNVWYWLRLRQEPNASAQGGLNDVFGKAWLADGTVAEPAGWQHVWDYTPANPTRAGYAGITASSGGVTDFDVDYVLIKAAALPSIVVAPNSFTQTPVAITNQPQSQTVTELFPATFSVGARGNPPPGYQWYQGARAIVGATNPSYHIPSAALSDNQAQFKVVAQNVVSNVPYSVTSGVAVLTVIADTNPPALLSAQALGFNQIRISFSERISAATATNLSNFSITNAGGFLLISSASRDLSQTNILLNVATMTDGSLYTLTVNNLTDQSAAANLIASNSRAQFVASAYTLASIGNPLLPGSQTPAGNGYNIAAAGSGLNGTADQCNFSYQAQSGDFDYQVRLDSLDLADAWTEAGLLVREDLTPGARCAGILATPSISGAFFPSRTVINGALNVTGSFPVNYPDTWLRLKRAGNTLSGFAGFDGQNWASLGTVTMALPTTLYFGFIVASQNPNSLATAAFRDFAPVTIAGTNLPPAREGLAQCNRPTSLVFSEIMYHPTNSLLEFVELFNSRAEPQDLGGYQLAGSIAYTFPAGTVIAGGGILVVAKSPADLQSAYGLSGVFGPYTNNLPNNKGTVRLLSQAGALLLQVHYDSTWPWPIAPDGAGHSLVLARPSYGSDNVLAWAASDAVGGSPGRLDPVTPDPLRNVVINEFLPHTDFPDLDYVELYNHSSQPVDISGCILTDNAATNKFIVPSPTIIPPGGFVYCNESNLNFALSAAGETIYFKNAAQTRVLDAVRLEAQENGVAMGRFPDGGKQFYRLTSKTPGAPNAPIRVSDIVINEIMYAPVSFNDDDQYVELYNRGTNTVDLGGWQFVDGISFVFPPHTLVPPDGYLVVARNAARLLTNYPNLNAGNLMGDFSGNLSHGGERLALAKPDTLIITNASGIVLTNTILIPVNEVTYQTGGRWGQWAHAGGSSLELVDPRADNTLAPNWADSDETHKAPWTIISATGKLDNGTVAADELQVLLQGQGECLLDEVQVLNSSSNNLIANSTFELGASGWVAEGTESTSSLETSEGYHSAQCYHVRAVEKGDNQVNRVRTLLTSPLPAGAANVTIRAAVRWLKGTPEILLRLRGNWLECAAELTPPANPGTPGVRNSRYRANAPPAIVGASHSPILPAANEPIVVTARVHDPDGVAAVRLKYRLDPSSSYSTLSMNDSGLEGDSVAGDGIFSATIPGQPTGTLIAFYLQATDAAGGTATFPSDAPTRECLARTGESEPTGNFPVYRIWMTQTTLNKWNNTSKLNNSYNDVTFVLGHERVIYNAGGRYKGSPYISPGYCGATCGRCGYSLAFPADDLFLGEQDLVLDWAGGHGGETTGLQEQMGYWIADRLNLPWSHRYTMRLHVNGVTDDTRQTAFEAIVQPGGGFIDEWSPNDNQGELFKIERAFEFSDGGGLTADPEPRLQLYTTTGGVKKRERYRWSWMFRSTDRRDDYANIFALVDAVNAARPEPYTTATLNLVDMEEWMGIFATEHIIVNFDAYGHEIGKNMYAYLPDNGKWQLYMFDLDWLMLAAPRYNPNYAASSAPIFNAEDPTITRMYSFPPFARAYWRAIQNAVNGPLDPAQCNPVIDAKSRSLFANGIRWCDGQALTDGTVVKNWFSQRRAYLQSQLATVAAPFSVSSVVLSNNLALLSGTAPMGIQTIAFNGIPWPLTWNSVTGWTAAVVLQPGTNQLALLGLAPHGREVPGASNNVSVVYTSALPSPVGQIVINEIMYNPPSPGAEYVELYNTSSNFAFDLSGWQFHGLAYTFSPGSLIGPNSFLVLAANRAAFAAAYGATNRLFDVFPGKLQPDGETLSLFKPGTSSVPDLLVTQVRYSNTAPWPAAADRAGTALQLIDPRQDNWRVGNWAAAHASNSSGSSATQWVHFSTVGTAPSSRLNIYLRNSGLAYVDDLSLVAGTVPETGANLLANGDFESPLGGTWNLGPDFSLSAQDQSVKHSGGASLGIVATAAGNSDGDAVFQDISPALTIGQKYALSLWYLQSTNPNTPALTVELSGSGLTSGIIYPTPVDSGSVGQPATPGAANSVAQNLPPFPTLWINEVQADNLTGITNSAGQRTAWIELYNPSTNVLSLEGLYLAPDYNNLITWAFPANAFIQPGEFKVVFADGQTSLSTSNELHASSVLSPGTGSIALSRIYNGQPQVLDYLDYANLSPNHSYGSFPDGQSFARREFVYVTPRSTNNASSAPLTVVINEWMAGNTHTLVDPVTGKFGDWFELYNYGTTAANLSGYYVTDVLTNQFKFLIPAGFSIPPQGFLLVWADGKITNGTPDLHISFKLNKAGESIGLFGADGQAVDYVTYGAQNDDISEGRYPDGASPFVFMPNPTPGTNNTVPNTAPVLAPIGDRYLILGQILTFTASATDTDQPPQTLTFALGPGAPVGATINPFNGLLTWTPTIAPSTNQITIIVSDDGLPSLSSGQSLTIIVLPPPQLVNFRLTGNELIFTWPTLPGQRYQLEYKDDLGPGAWNPLGGQILGTGQPVTVTNSVSLSQRFFHLMLLP